MERWRHPSRWDPIDPADLQNGAVVTNLRPVDGDDQGTSGWHPDDDWADDDAHAGGLRGWISPDDRLWRHPSESRPASSTSTAFSPGEARAGTRDRLSPWIVGGGTVCLVVALVTAGLVLSTTGRSDQDSSATVPEVRSLTGAPTTEPGVGTMVASRPGTGMLSTIRRSTVAVSVKTSSGTSVATGLVAESGGIIVTLAAVLSGARSIAVIEPDGTRQVADEVGIDTTSGLAVVRIADDLPAAVFDDGELASGKVAVAMALEPNRRSGSAPTPVVYAGSVVSTGLAVDLDAVTTTFAATAIEAPLSPHDIGCPLLDSTGHVTGMLEKVAQTGVPTMSVFLPAELVLGVARQLVSWGTMNHGWFGVTTSDHLSTNAAAVPDGATLVSIDAGSPAAGGGLQPGDVITRIDGEVVRSEADLRTRLYADPPGTTLAVDFERGRSGMTTSLVLGQAGGDAPRGPLSP